MTAFRISRSVAPALAWLALSLAPSAHADYLWLQRDGAQARVFAGELPKPLAQLPALRDAKAVAPEDQPLAVETAANHFAFTPPAQGDARFTATRAGADGVLTFFQAKFGRAEPKAVNDLELVPTEAGGNTFQLVFKGRPVAASQVNVDTSEGWRRVLTPAKDGTVSFVPSFPGLYVLEVSARVDSGAVTIDGKKYADVRHTATLSFEVTR